MVQFTGGEATQPVGYDFDEGGCSAVIYTINELRQIISPITKKYGIPAVYVFGSYARDEATEDSDVDILIDRTGSAIRNMLDMGELYGELRKTIGKEIDLVTIQALEQEHTKRRTPMFVDSVISERIVLYD